MFCLPPHNSKMWTEAMSTLAKMYPKLREEERAAILLKGATMSSSERDSGFNSGSSEHEEDLWSRDGLISPENASSEESVPELKVPVAAPSSSSSATSTTSSVLKNKRKSSEPLRVVAETELLAPLKKRIRFDEERRRQQQLREEEEEREREREAGGSPRPSSRATTTSPFRPWAPPEPRSSSPPAALPQPADPFPNPADLLVRHPAVTTLHRAVTLKPLEQLQPLDLVAKKSSSVSPQQAASGAHHLDEWHHRAQHQGAGHFHSFPPPPAAPSSLDGTGCESVTGGDRDPTPGCLPLVSPSGRAASSSAGSISGHGSQTRNYKNMTRERRIEANARERTRVHTISAAYEKLRKAVPAYSDAQKLSKLSILRIACSYILTLSRMAGEDYSEDGSEPSIADCVEKVTKTIQTEGKIRKKKDE